MSDTLRMSPRPFIVVIVAVAFSIFAHAQSAKKISRDPRSKERLIGAWHLVHIDAPGPDGKSVPIPQPKGMLIYTRDGHVSVQLMYPASANTLSNEYVLNGYEASFGSYDVDETAHTVTHHVQGSITRDLLVGKDLSRKFEFAADGHLIIRSARADEHWSVTWKHYQRRHIVGITGRAYLGHKMTEKNKSNTLPSVLSGDDVRAVSPALEHYTKELLLDGLWKRLEMSPRDRSIVTVAALIARIQTIEMPFHFALALDNGVKPSELSEIITHLAFYSGWANAMSAVAVAKDIFHQRGIGIDQVPPAKDKLTPLNEDAEAQRAFQVSNNFGKVSPGLVQNTADVLFRDLWLRPALAPRDRSLVTLSALIASGQVAQITYHLNRAMDNGLTQAEASEIVTHIAYYAGWPNAFSALPVVKEVFEKRQK